MKRRNSVILIVMLLLCCSGGVSGGLISYLSCMAAVGTGGFVTGSAVLPLLGFTSSGIAAGSWAASIMAAYGGAIPAGSLFATLQSMGATGFTMKAFGGLSTFCTALTAPLP